MPAASWYSGIGTAPSDCAASIEAYRRGRFSPTTTMCWPRRRPACGKAASQLTHQLGQLRPGGGLPDAVFLDAQRRRSGPLPWHAPASALEMSSAPESPLPLHPASRRPAHDGAILGGSLTPRCRCDDIPRVDPGRDFPGCAVSKTSTQRVRQCPRQASSPGLATAPTRARRIGRRAGSDPVAAGARRRRCACAWPA